jgi:hypothetical protein
MEALMVMTVAKDGEYSINGKKEQPSLDGEFRLRKDVIGRGHPRRDLRADRSVSEDHGCQISNSAQRKV